MRSIFVLLILVMIGLNGKGQSVTALPDSVLSQCCLEVTLLNGNVTTVDWVFVQYITRDGTGTKLFVEYAPNFGGIQWETQIRIQDDFDDVLERSKFIVIPFTVGSTDYGINRNWIANIEENTTTGGTWIYGRFGTPTKRKFSAVEDYETMKNLLLACRPRAIVVAENGLYTEGDTVRMGGFLIEPTTIQTNTYDFKLIDTLTSLQFGIAYNFVFGDTVIYMNRYWDGGNNAFYFGRNRFSFQIDGSDGSQLRQFGSVGVGGVNYNVIASTGTQQAVITLGPNAAGLYAQDISTDSYSNVSSSAFISQVHVGDYLTAREVGVGAYREIIGGRMWPYIRTDKISDSTATDGQFLQLQNYLTGEAEWATIDLSAYLPIADTAAMLDPYIQGAGTLNYLPKFTAGRVIGNSNIFDNNTYAGVIGRPWKFGEFTTAGLPTGVTGYHVYNTTIGGTGWYDGTRWNVVPKAVKSAFTSTYIPFTNSSGQFDETVNLRYNSANGYFYMPQFISPRIETYTDDVVFVAGANGRIRFKAPSGMDNLMWFYVGGVYKGQFSAGNTQFAINHTGNIYIAQQGGVLAYVNIGGAGTSIGTGSTVPPSYYLHVQGTDAIGLPRGTVGNQPAIVSNTTPMRFFTDTAAIGYGHGGVYNFVATRAYVRSLAVTDTWLGSRLATGSVSISEQTRDLRLGLRGFYVDSIYINSQSVPDNTIIVNKAFSGSTGITALLGGSNTVFNGTLTGTHGGFGNYVSHGATLIANSSGSNFNNIQGISVVAQGSRNQMMGYNIDGTGSNGQNIAFGRNIKILTYDNFIGIGDSLTATANGQVKIGNSLNNSQLFFGQKFIYDYDTYLLQLSAYGTSATTAASLGLTESGYIAAFDPNGKIYSKATSSLADGNGIYSSSATLANHTTRARLPDDGNLLFSQLFNSSTDSMYLYFRNYGSGERAFGFGLTDTASTGYTRAEFSSDGSGEMNWALQTSGTSGTTSVRSDAGSLSLTTSGGGISLNVTTDEYVSVTGYLAAKQEAYNEITSTSSPQTLSSQYSDNLINQGGTQASFTFEMPPSPEDGQVCTLTYNNAISVLTLDGNGETIIGTAVTTAVAGSQRKFKFYAGIGWIKIY